MANLIESPIYESGIFQLEKSTPPLGGPPVIDAGIPSAGHANVQSQQLANRTAWLKQQIEAIEDVNTGTIAEVIAARDASEGFAITGMGYLQGSQAAALQTNQGKLDAAASADAAADTVAGIQPALDAKVSLVDLANPSDPSKGISLASWDGDTVAAQMNLSKKLVDYSSLRAYTGTATRVCITADKIAGKFRRRVIIPGEIDNNGTVILTTDGLWAWERQYDGAIYATWFDLKGDGATDHSVRLQVGVTAAAAAGKEIIITADAYNLATPVNGNGTQLVILEPGVTLTGAGGLYKVSIEAQRAQGREFSTTGVPGPYATVGDLLRVTNTGGAGYGRRANYFHTGVMTTGFSIGDGVVSSFQNLQSGAQGLASWLVTASPTDITNSWGLFCQEMNPINRSADMGYVKTRGATIRWTGGMHIVPEATDLTGAVGNNTYNTSYAYAVAHSGGLNALGKNVKTYNGFLIEKDSIAPGGRGLLASGDSSGISADKPLFAVEIDQSWKHGLYTRDAVFDSGRAVVLGNAQYIAIDVADKSNSPSILGVNSTNATLIGSAVPNGPVQFRNNGGGAAMNETAFQVTTLVGAVAYLDATPSTTNTPTISAKSSTLLNANIALVPKGTGAVMPTVRSYADDTAAAAGGIPVGGMYHTAGTLKVRLT